MSTWLGYNTKSADQACFPFNLRVQTPPTPSTPKPARPKRKRRGKEARPVAPEPHPTLGFAAYDSYLAKTVEARKQAQNRTNLLGMTEASTTMEDLEVPCSLGNPMAVPMWYRLLKDGHFRSSVRHQIIRSSSTVDISEWVDMDGRPLGFEEAVRRGFAIWLHKRTAPKDLGQKPTYKAKLGQKGRQKGTKARLVAPKLEHQKRFLEVRSAFTTLVHCEGVTDGLDGEERLKDCHQYFRTANMKSFALADDPEWHADVSTDPQVVQQLDGWFDRLCNGGDQVDKATFTALIAILEGSLYAFETAHPSYTPITHLARNRWELSDPDIQAFEMGESTWRVYGLEWEAMLAFADRFWRHIAPGSIGLDRPCFHAALLLFVELWCETIAIDEHLNFLNLMHDLALRPPGYTPLPSAPGPSGPFQATSTPPRSVGTDSGTDPDDDGTPVAYSLTEPTTGRKVRHLSVEIPESQREEGSRPIETEGGVQPPQAPLIPTATEPCPSLRLPSIEPTPEAYQLLLDRECPDDTDAGKQAAGQKRVGGRVGLKDAIPAPSVHRIATLSSYNKRYFPTPSRVEMQEMAFTLERVLISRIAHKIREGNEVDGPNGEGSMSVVQLMQDEVIGVDSLGDMIEQDSAPFSEVLGALESTKLSKSVSCKVTSLGMGRIPTASAANRGPEPLHTHPTPPRLEEGDIDRDPPGGGDPNIPNCPGAAVSLSIFGAAVRPPRPSTGVLRERIHKAVLTQQDQKEDPGRNGGGASSNNGLSVVSKAVSSTFGTKTLSLAQRQPKPEQMQGCSYLAQSSRVYQTEPTDEELQAEELLGPQTSAPHPPASPGAVVPQRPQTAPGTPAHLSGCSTLPAAGLPDRLQALPNVLTVDTPLSSRQRASAAAWLGEHGKTARLEQIQSLYNLYARKSAKEFPRGAPASKDRSVNELKNLPISASPTAKSAFTRPKSAPPELSEEYKTLSRKSKKYPARPQTFLRTY